MPQINRVGPQIGAEITGVDVKTLDDAGLASSTGRGSTTTSWWCATRS